MLQCKDTCPTSRYDYNPRPVASYALSAVPSRVPPPRGIRFSVAEILDSANFKRIMDLVRNMPTGSQLRLLLRLMVISCLLYPLPFIYLELSRKFQSVVNNCEQTSIFLK